MIVVGLTGGIAMGKSRVAAQFRRAKIPVFDADAAVHRLQAPGGRALPAIARAFPGTVEDNRLLRARLRSLVLSDPNALKRLEAILHPLVRAEERRFLARARRHRARVAVLDVPLLFETGGVRRVDRTITVSAPPAIQRARVLRRGAMSAAQLAAVLARQLPDAERRRRADIVIRTGLSKRHAQAQLARLLPALRLRDSEPC